MPVSDLLRVEPPRTSASPPLVFEQDRDTPDLVDVRSPSLKDFYDIGVGRIGAGTSVIFSIGGTGWVLLRERPPWETWLPEIAAPVAVPPSRSAVGKQIEEIQGITNLSDQQLAEAFPGGVSRETVNRWRNRPDTNMRPENLYRLGILHELALRMDKAGINGPVWLHQPTADSDQSPYTRICSGELGLVRGAVEAVIAGAAGAEDAMVAASVDRAWDANVDEGEDDGEWTWEETVEDASE